MSDVLPATRDRIVMRQQWHELLFLHWPMDAAALQAMLPPGLIVDTFDGQAYIGLVPFRMTGVTPAWMPPVSFVSDLLECNVRTYVRRADGSSPGVWFFSLDAETALAVGVARAAFALPYFRAKMHISRYTQRHGSSWRRYVYYSTERNHPGAAPGYCKVDYSVGSGRVAPAETGSLEEFLVERYRLYAFRNGRLYDGLVHHNPYQIESADLLSLDENLIAADGVHRPAGLPPLVHYSRRVVVEVSPLRPVVQ